jgi:predicted lipoprotein with Yx(FWY)xxD motif
MQKKQWAVVAGLIAAALTVSACESASTNDPSAMATQSANMSTTMTPTPMQAQAASAGMMTSKGGLMKSEHTMAGTVLANPHGMTVYYYSVDKKGSGVSSCTGTCATEWPPVVSPVRIPAGVKLAGKVSYIVRANGVRQVTINGYPVYRYAGDHAPGEANGSGIGGVWHVFTIMSSMSSSSMSSSSMSSSSAMTPTQSASSPSSSGGGGGW